MDTFLILFCCFMLVSCNSNGVTKNSIYTLKNNGVSLQKNESFLSRNDLLSTSISKMIVSPTSFSTTTRTSDMKTEPTVFDTLTDAYSSNTTDSEATIKSAKTIPHSVLLTSNRENLTPSNISISIESISSSLTIISTLFSSSSNLESSKIFSFNVSTSSAVPSSIMSVTSSLSHMSTVSPLSRMPSTCSVVIKSETICESSFIKSLSPSSMYIHSSQSELMSTIYSSSLKPTFIINSTAISSLSLKSSFVLNSTATYTQSKTTQLSSTVLSSMSQHSSISSVSTILFPSTTLSPSLSSVIIMSAHILKPALTTCDIVASNFSIVLNNYTSCILANLKPMEVCFKCINEYEMMHQYHRKVYRDCGKRLIGNYNARYQVIAQLFQIQQQTWDSLECEKCYNRQSQSPSTNPEFQTFQKLYNDVKKCFHLHRNTGNKTLNGSSSNGTVCTQCLSLYNEFQSKFKFQEDSEENTDTIWCADINVAVNETRHLWSGRFHCGEKEKDLASIIALTCFFCFLPIVFYVGAKLHADVKERKTNRYYESE